MKDFRRARKRADVSLGESVRIVRELQRLSQNQLFELSGIPRATLWAIERDRVGLAVECAGACSNAPLSPGGIDSPRLGPLRRKCGLSHRSTGRERHTA